MTDPKSYNYFPMIFCASAAVKGQKMRMGIFHPVWLTFRFIFPRNQFLLYLCVGQNECEIHSLLKLILVLKNMILPSHFHLLVYSLAKGESHASYADDTLPLYNSPRTAAAAIKPSWLRPREAGEGGIKTYAPSSSQSGFVCCWCGHGHYLVSCSLLS